MARKTKLVKFISKMVDEVTQGQLTSDEAATQIYDFIQKEQEEARKKILGEQLPFML